MIGGNVIIKATLTVSRDCPQCKQKIEKQTAEAQCKCGWIWKDKEI